MTPEKGVRTESRLKPTFGRRFLAGARVLCTGCHSEPPGAVTGAASGAASGAVTGAVSPSPHVDYRHFLIVAYVCPVVAYRF